MLFRSRRLANVDGRLSDVARLDGDSFAVFAHLPDDGLEAPEIAEAITAAVAGTYTMTEGSARIGVKIGYSVTAEGDTCTAETALGRAEDALDQTRSAGGALVRRFDAEAADRRFRHRSIERAMAGAIENGEFSMVYQPQHRLSDGALIGVESLVRWDSPALGRVFPDEFIEIAESTGAIIDLGRWVLLRSAQDAMHLPDDVKMAVNVSGLQMMHGDVARDVLQTLDETGLPARRLCLELTESVLLSPTPEMIEAMRDIQVAGVTWALDDYGTGYASMGYLSTLPFGKVKLDKSFVMGIGTGSAALASLRSVGVLCEGLGLTLLCEGVERESDIAVLREIGCTEGQGYFFGKPQRLEGIVKAAVARSPGVV